MEYIRTRMADPKGVLSVRDQIVRNSVLKYLDPMVDLKQRNIVQIFTQLQDLVKLQQPKNNQQNQPQLTCKSPF